MRDEGMLKEDSREKHNTTSPPLLSNDKDSKRCLVFLTPSQGAIVWMRELTEHGPWGWNFIWLHMQILHKSLNLFFIIFDSVCARVGEGQYVHITAGVLWGQRDQIHLELELQGAVSGKWELNSMSLKEQYMSLNNEPSL